MSSLLLFGSVTCALWASNFLIKRFVLNSRPPVSRTLYLREITCSSEHMLQGATQTNVFVDEFSTLFDFLCNSLDCAVMKYVDQDVPILSKQESKHAILHLAQMKQRKQEGESASRWKWFLWLADLLLLRCGAGLGRPLCLHIESACSFWLYAPLALPFVKNCMSNLFVFHGLEELEHGSLTVQSLRRQTNLLVLVATFPIVVIVHFVILLSPPIVLLIVNPRILLSPSSYVDLVNYYLTFGVGFALSTLGQICYALLPFRKSMTRFNAMHELYEKEMETRRITYNVLEKDTYVLA